MLRLTNSSSSFLDLLYPQLCASCHGDLPYTHSDPLCLDCEQGLYSISTLACQRCGYPALASQTPLRKVCPRCRLPDFPLARVRSLYGYGGVMRDLLHQFKYQQSRNAAQGLRKLMQRGAESLRLPWSEYDLVLAVPLSLPKLRQRGFNQSQWLLDSIPFIRSCQTSVTLLCREGESHSQVGLGMRQRLQNLRGSFTVRSSQHARCNGASILLVDDVWTTGATLHACALALLEAGAVQIEALTLCRAIL